MQIYYFENNIEGRKDGAGVLYSEKVDGLSPKAKTLVSFEDYNELRNFVIDTVFSKNIGQEDFITNCKQMAHKFKVGIL